MNNLLNLLQLSDPVLPIGAFAHSYGLETYVQDGLVNDKSSAKIFLTEMLSQSVRYTDGAFASLAYDATVRLDVSEVARLDEECTAVKAPREIRQASIKLGTRLFKIFSTTTQKHMPAGLFEQLDKGFIKGNYSIVFGILAAALQIQKDAALTGFYYNAAAGMITNAVKLIPLGQQDGQEILFSIQPLIYRLVEQTMNPDRELIGLCCVGFDIRCMQHETLYSRLYMS